MHTRHPGDLENSTEKTVPCHVGFWDRNGAWGENRQIK